jgi:hypothetical protein
MTTSALSTSSAPSRITYARARLLLGISGVGTAVIIATAVLAFEVPARLLSNAGAQPIGEAVVSIVLILLLSVAVFFPFDVFGGAIIVRERTPVPVFLARWMRGVAVQLVVWTVSAAALMVAARLGGTDAAITAFVALQFALAALRAPMMRLIASFTVVPMTDRLRTIASRAGIAADRIDVLSSTDEGFVGGWNGITPRRLVLPARWLELPDDLLIAALQRRRIIAESGAHLRGVIGAVAWNTLGLLIVLALSGAQLGNAAGILTLAAGMTLWAFVGVLLLPTPSRAAVHAVDVEAARAVGTAVMQESIERLDRWQDDEPKRSKRVETIFHPVPSRSAREANLAAATPQGGVKAYHPHHLARHALWLGWATLSPISRAVHCNVGRTALWAMLPGD